MYIDIIISVYPSDMSFAKINWVCELTEGVLPQTCKKIHFSIVTLNFLVNFFIITLRADLKHLGLFLVNSLKTNLQLGIFQTTVHKKVTTISSCKRKFILMQDKFSDTSLESKKG